MDATAKHDADIREAVRLAKTPVGIVAKTVSWSDGVTTECSCFGRQIADTTVHDTAPRSTHVVVGSDNYARDMCTIPVHKFVCQVGNLSTGGLRAVPLHEYVNGDDGMRRDLAEFGHPQSDDPWVKPNELAALYTQTAIFRADGTHVVYGIYPYADNCIGLVASPQGTSVCAIPAFHRTDIGYMRARGGGTITQHAFVCHASEAGAMQDVREALTKETELAAAAKGHATLARYGIDGEASVSDAFLFLVPCIPARETMARGSGTGPMLYGGGPPSNGKVVAMGGGLPVPAAAGWLADSDSDNDEIVPMGRDSRSWAAPACARPAPVMTQARVTADLDTPWPMPDGMGRFTAGDPTKMLLQPGWRRDWSKNIVVVKTRIVTPAAKHNGMATVDELRAIIEHECMRSKALYGATTSIHKTAGFVDTAGADGLPTDKKAKEQHLANAGAAAGAGYLRAEFPV